MFLGHRKAIRHAAPLEKQVHTKRPFPQDLRPNDTVPLHDPKLLGGQFALLQEDFAGNADLTDIMKRTCEKYSLHEIDRHPESFGEYPGIAPDPGDVVACHFIAKLPGLGQTPDDIEPGDLQIPGPLLDPALEGRVEMLKLIVPILQTKHTSDSGDQILKIYRLGKQVGRPKVQGLALDVALMYPGKHYGRDIPGGI